MSDDTNSKSILKKIVSFFKLPVPYMLTIPEEELNDLIKQRTDMHNMIAYKLATNDYIEDDYKAHFHFNLRGKKITLSSVEIASAGLHELRDLILREMQQKDKSLWIIDLERNIIDDQIKIEKKTVSPKRL